MDFEIIRSKRKTMSLEITKSCEILVRAPLKMPESVINSFVEKHNEWITDKIEIQKRRQETVVSGDDISGALIKNAKEYIPERVEFYSKIMNLKPTSIKITSAKTRFGSCSGKNAICFSWRLMQYPDVAIDYVIVHELAHIKHHNHSREFYCLIEKYMPDYKDRRKLLR